MAGNSVAARSLASDAIASDSKADALRLLNDAIDRSGLPRKAIASECGLSESQFSRLTSGVQGFPVALLDKLAPAIRADWLERMRDREQVIDPVVHATAQLAKAAVTLLALIGGTRKRMAKAGL